MWGVRRKNMNYNQRMNLEQELYHYGIPGMKWGHRKAVMSNPNVMAARAKHKAANKAFNKAYRKARRPELFSPSKEVHKANKKRKWDDALSKGVAADKAKKEYKSAVKSAKQKAKIEYSASKEKKKQYKEVYKKSIKAAEQRAQQKLKDLKKRGRQNDINAVDKVWDAYDKEFDSAVNKYKSAKRSLKK